MLKRKVILLKIFPVIKRAYIVETDIIYRALSTIYLEYSPDIKNIELQVLLHGYKILKKTDFDSNYREVYELESI